MPPLSEDLTFFRSWTPEMAYVLGYWWADGYMRFRTDNGAHMVELASNDHDHLQTMAHLIKVGARLWKVKLLGNCYQVAFCNRGLYNDLLALGGIPNKSNVIGFPFVPTDLLVHFVRGFVDGDGTLAWNGDRPILQIYSGSKQLLADMAAAVEQQTGIPALNVVANRALWYLKWSTIRAKCLAAWLYVEHPGLALDRKAAIAEHFLQWKPKKRPERGTITDEMRWKFWAYLPAEE